MWADEIPLTQIVAVLLIEPLLRAPLLTGPSVGDAGDSRELTADVAEPFAFKLSIGACAGQDALLLADRLVELGEKTLVVADPRTAQAGAGIFAEPVQVVLAILQEFLQSIAGERQTDLLMG